MILSDHTLMAYGEHIIHPFEPDAVQPASIDLRLSDEFVTFDRDEEFLPIALDRIRPSGLTFRTPYLELQPGEFALGSTIERVTIPTGCAARIEGKSSIGRLGLLVHMTAGYIDPGFNGNITLELLNARTVPIILCAGLYICQLSVIRLDRPALNPYRGRYQNDQGTVASKYGGE